jgi:predicted phage replisome organizer
MAEIKWVKLHTNMFQNSKLKHLRSLPEGDKLALIWIMLLATAGRCNANGWVFLTENIPYTPKMLAKEFDCRPSTVAAALHAFEDMDMIMIDGGFIHVQNWLDYQNADRLEELRAKDRERKRKQREKEKSAVECPRTSVESPQTEEEEEEEEEGEEDFHSFVHSPKTAEERLIEKKVAEAGFEGKDAEQYREELRENIRLKYLGGTLGQGVVLISGEQFDDLCRRLSLDEIEKYFAIVVECEQNGKRFKRKSHYQAILDMAARDRMVEGDET